MSKFKKLVEKQKQLKEDKKYRFNLEARTNANRVVVACPCNKDKKYVDCCAKIHEDITKAETPEQLMRSRYSAYVLGMIEFLMKSHHSSTRPLKEKEEILKWAKSVKWLGLDVLETNTNQVTFKAHFLEGLKKQVIHEKSNFEKENGYWTYVDGVHH